MDPLLFHSIFFFFFFSSIQFWYNPLEQSRIWVAWKYSRIDFLSSQATLPIPWHACTLIIQDHEADVPQHPLKYVIGIFIAYRLWSEHINWNDVLCLWCNLSMPSNECKLSFSSFTIPIKGLDVNSFYINLPSHTPKTPYMQGFMGQESNFAVTYINFFI